MGTNEVLGAPVPALRTKESGAGTDATPRNLAPVPAALLVGVNLPLLRALIHITLSLTAVVTLHPKKHTAVDSSDTRLAEDNSGRLPVVYNVYRCQHQHTGSSDGNSGKNLGSSPVMQ